MSNNLKRLREKRGLTQTQLAEAMGTTINQITKLESGKRRLSDVWIARAAKALGVDAGLLVTDQLGGVPLVGFVAAGAHLQFFDGSHGPFDEVSAPPYRTESTVAAEVRGDSMRGLANDRWLIYWDDVREPVTDDLIGETCVVWLDDGQALVKELHRGTAPGLYNLESTTAATMRDVRVVSAALVTAIVPRAIARRHERRRA